MSQSRYQEALDLLDEIEAHIERLPQGLHDLARANAIYARTAASFYVSGSKLVGLGLLGHDQSEPLRLAREAVSLYRETAPASLALAVALNLVGYNLTYTPLNEEAFAPLLKALQIKEALVGSKHTSLIITLNYLAAARFQTLVQKHKTIVAEGTALSAGEHNLKYHRSRWNLVRISF